MHVRINLRCRTFCCSEIEIYIKILRYTSGCRKAHSADKSSKCSPPKSARISRIEFWVRIPRVACPARPAGNDAPGQSHCLHLAGPQHVATNVECYKPGCVFLSVHYLRWQFYVAGMKFAMLEMKATLSSLLRKYQLLPASPQHHLDLTVVVVLQSLTGVVLRIQPRPKQPANTSEWH